MDLRAVVFIVLCISCALGGKHEKQKWKEEKSTKDCDKITECLGRTSKDLKHSSGKIGSVPGKPGVDYPNFTEIPYTKFTCADQDYVPGFYPDFETNCQVFHVCYEHRRESFLCPVGTIFSQPIQACDFWYSANCSRQAKHEKPFLVEETADVESLDPIMEELITVMFEQEISEQLFSESDKPSDKKVHPKPAKYTAPEPTTTAKVEEPEPELQYKEKTHGFFKPGKDFTGDEVFKHLGKDEELSSSDSDEHRLKPKGRELTSAFKGDAEIATSLILKSLLPIKSQVISLVAEQMQKSKEKEKKSLSKKETSVEPTPTPAPVTVKETKKPQQPTEPSAPRFVGVPVVKATRKTKPLQFRPPFAHVPPQPIYKYRPAQFSTGKAGMPISLLTKKQLALNYAKLLKLRKLKIPLLGLKGFHW